MFTNSIGKGKLNNNDDCIFQLTTFEFFAQIAKFRHFLSLSTFTPPPLFIHLITK